MIDHNLDADVIIVGGGIIGGNFALLLAKAGLEVLLLESAVRPDPRVLAITPSSQHILNHSGVWRRLDSSLLGHFRKMHVWQGQGHINFDSASICAPTLGYIIAAQHINESIAAEIKESPQIRTIIAQQATHHIQSEANHIGLTFADQSCYRAKLLIGADGANSSIRSLAGIGHQRQGYHQSALCCVVETQRHHQDIARQYFLSQGPLALLPMAEPYQSALIWSSDPKHINDLLEMPAAAFHEAVASGANNHLGAVQKSHERVSFSLSRMEADRYIQNQVALIGDSAHTVHPLSGLGANMGLLDVAVLAEVLITAHSQKRDIGAYITLRRYERQRIVENHQMVVVIDMLKQLFAFSSPTLNHLCGGGMIILDRMPWLKHWIMQQAMGMSESLPKYART